MIKIPYLAKGNSKDVRKMNYFMDCPEDVKPILIKYSEDIPNTGPEDFSLLYESDTHYLIKNPAGGRWDREISASTYQSPFVSLIPKSFKTHKEGETVWEGQPGLRLDKMEIARLIAKVKGMAA